jgi:hypothetical protein
MKRTASAAITALIFLAAIIAWATYQAHGNPFASPAYAWMIEHHEWSIRFMAISLGYVALAAWIAAALAGGRARLAVALGWLAALPTLIGIFSGIADSTGLSRMIVGDPLEDADAYYRLPARLLNGARGVGLLIGLNLPFSAGPVFFGLAYPIVMAMRGAWRLLRRAHGGGGR